MLRSQPNSLCRNIRKGSVTIYWDDKRNGVPWAVRLASPVHWVTAIVRAEQPGGAPAIFQALLLYHLTQSSQQSSAEIFLTLRHRWREETAGCYRRFHTHHKSILQVHNFLFWGKFHLCLILDSRYKWHHMEFVFLFLAYFTQYQSL